jgi:hypothetical protein
LNGERVKLRSDITATIFISSIECCDAILNLCLSGSVPLGCRGDDTEATGELATELKPISNAKLLGIERDLNDTARWVRRKRSEIISLQGGFGSLW